MRKNNILVGMIVMISLYQTPWLYAADINGNTIIYDKTWVSTGIRDKNGNIEWTGLPDWQSWGMRATEWTGEWHCSGAQACAQMQEAKEAKEGQEVKESTWVKAVWWEVAWKDWAASTSWESEGGPTTVTVTEEIPGMKCDAVPPKEWEKSGPESKKYKCTIQPGFGSVMLILRGLIKYATFITALIAVLMLVVSGVQYSIAGADKWAADAAKKRIGKVIAGIILLFLIGFILNSVMPAVYS